MKVISGLSFVYVQWRVGPVGLVNIYSEEELITSLFTRIGFSSHTYFAGPLLAFPNDFWGRKWNPCFADKQQSGTLALTSCSNFSIEALTLTRLSLTIYSQLPILSGSNKGSVRVPQDQPNVLVYLPGPGQLLSWASPHIPHAHQRLLTVPGDK